MLLALGALSHLRHSLSVLQSLNYLQSTVVSLKVLYTAEDKFYLF